MKNKIAGLMVTAAGLLGALSATAATDWNTQEYDLYPGDFDGDGKTDLLYIAKDAAKVSGIARSDGSGPNIPFQSWPSNYLGIPWHSNLYTVLVEDFNGDGKADLFLQRNTPGDHFLLLADQHGKITGIAQTVSNVTFTLSWAAADHKILAGDFTGDGKADLLLQATSAAGTNAVINTDTNGLFTTGLLQYWTDASWSSFKWSTKNSNLFVGDFNGDNKKDLLVQAKPNIVMIDFDIPIPVPTYQPNSFGVVLSQGATTPFALGGVQQWSRNAQGVDWSPNAANIVIGNFDGSAGDDVLLQARNSSRPSYLIAGHTSGAAFTSSTALATNVTWGGDSYRLIAGNFDGGAAVGVYSQAQSSAGTNYYANIVTGSSVSQTAHNPGAATGVLPTTAVGHTVGSFAVTDGGAATYSIPIVVPPGVAGVQPALSIGYASGGGNGPLGVGWNLGGFSEIQRCNKTLAQDNVVEAVALAMTDRFCLDGNRLRLTAGAYGAANSTYQTEIETFSKVTAYGTAGNGPAYFTIEAKDGLTYEYGATGDSRIESLKPSATTTARAWALNKVTDRHGNSMSITYQEDGAPNGSYRPIQISYTTNAGASLSAAYKVVLTWDTRSDVLSSFFAGGLVKEIYRLNRIETQYYNTGSWQLVRKYQLSYNMSGVNGRSRLTTIQECDRNSNCLAPTTISWQEGTFGWSASQIGSTTLPASASSGIPVDINGDGRTDYVYFDSVTTYWRAMFANSDGTYQAPINVYGPITDSSIRGFPMDVNGDGRQDLLLANPSDGKWLWVRYFSGTSFTALPTTLSSSTPGGSGAFAADVNGDGLDDLVSASPTKLYVALNQSSATAPIFTVPTDVWTNPALTKFPSEPFGLQGERYATDFESVDFDGDGKDELLVHMVEDNCGGEPGCSGDFMYYWKVLQWTGSALTEKAVAYGNDTDSSRPLLADINADGLPDVIYSARIVSNSPTRSWRYRYGLSTTYVNTGVTAYGMGVISDCDSDGHADLVSSDGSGGFQCMKSSGAGLSPTTIPLGASGGTKIADLNGDGLLDFVELDSSNVLKARLHKGVIPDFVSNITDGFGSTVSVTYAPLTDSSVYTPASGAQLPVIDVQGAMYVVKQYSVSDGIGGNYSISESYTGAKAHVRGRGFLGFTTRTTIDGRTNIKSVSTFRQDYPYIGMVADASVYQANGTTRISQTINTPAELDTSTTAFNERKLPYVQQSVQKSFEVGGVSNGQQITQVTTTTTPDSYGNPTNIATSTVDSASSLTYSSTTVNTYDTADDNCWWRGFITQQQVTNTVPGYSAQSRTVQFVKDTANLPACRVYQQIVEPSDNAVKVTTTFGYDSFGHPNSEIISAANIAPRTTTTGYGAEGVFPTSVTNALSQSASKTYDYALGVPKTATDPNGLIVTFDYDGFGRLTQENRPDGTKTALIYSACTVINGYCGDSRLRYQVEKRELDAGSGVIRTSRQLFDAFGRSLYNQSQTLSGGFSNVATNYDNQGRAYQQSQPYFSGFPAYFTTITYDLLGRPTQEDRRISEADSGTQTTAYGYNKLVHTQTDANQKTTTKEFNAIGQVAKVTDAASGITQYEYDQFGNLKKTTDPLGNQIVNNFNIRGFKTSTSDPDMGNWVYTYYQTGELWTQTDAKSQLVTFTYDALSRPSTRVEPDGTTTFVYGNNAVYHNIGKLASVSSPGSYSESFTYDSLGRLQDATTNADSTSFVVSNAYNSTTGFLETVTYPTSTSAVAGSRFKLKYEYEAGLLKRTRDFNSPSTIYWEQVATNAAGQAIDELYGNGLHTYSSYDGITGLLGARTAGASSQIQNLIYQWDKIGNLKQRKDNALGATEDFNYDNLYRLDDVKLNTVQTLDMKYDALGNITEKNEPGVTAFNYNTAQSGCTYYTHAQPHAVRKVGSSAVYCYDANGNMSKRAGSNITWYSYNLPNRVDNGSNYSQFYYGADRARYKQVAYTAAGGSLPAGTETTIYIGGLFEKVSKPSGVTEYKHYILTGKEAVAVRTLRSNSIDDTRYLHKDHLGSVDVITNEAGGVVQRLSYDAFGKRRNATSWSGALNAGDWTAIAAITHRGYTFHEELDNVDLVHMNGRVYDPNIGRCISADPFIQAPLMSQSLNRYSYVMNNPLSLVDPSGYSWVSKNLRKFGRWAKRAWDGLRQTVNFVVGAALIVGGALTGHPEIIQLGFAVMFSPIQGGFGRGGPWISVGYSYAMKDPSQGQLGLPSSSPPPMTAPAGAISFAPPSLPEWLVDEFAGIGDSLTFGLTRAARDAFGVGSVNTSSSSYAVGYWGTTITIAVMSAGATMLPRAMTGGVTATVAVEEGSVASRGVTNPSIAKLPAPAVPAGMTQSQFGKELIGWGIGPDGAIARMQSLTVDAVAEMQSRGLTREMAMKWRDFYANEFNRNANNVAAQRRIKLMDAILGFMN
jgi:RHS repeat-associated protein